MQNARSTIRRRTTPPAASRERDHGKVELLVLHDDPRPAADALKSYAAKSSRRAPHYHISAAGAITRLVSEQRAARFAGKAEWKKRRRDIDRISISIALEHTPGAPYSWSLLSAAQVLIDRLSDKYKLAAGALYSWVSDPSLPVEQSVLVDAVLPADPAWFPWDTDGPPIPPLNFEIPSDIAGPLVLGEEAPSASQELWKALEQETFGRRGGGYRGDWTFHQRADAEGLGAPLAPNKGTNDKKYNYQVFARDTLFNEGQQWSNVQSLAGALAGAIPAAGPARQLLDASYQDCGATLFANQAFAQTAVRDRLGPALGNSYRQQIAGQMYVVQVFALDTLYTPLANPESATKWGDVRRLSQTPAGDLANGLWAETYKPCRAAYDPNSRFQQQAAAQRLGAPLSGVYQIPIGAAKYDIQVFALDTLYAGPDGAVQSKNALPHTAAAAPPPAPPAPPATIVPPSGGARAGILPASGLESAWLQQHPNAPEKAKNLIAQALCLLGPEETIFDQLPPNLRAMTYGALGKSPKDICCADYVSLSLAAAGLDFGWRDLEGTGNTMRARYYQPCSGNASKLRELGDGEAWLPGDILTYYSGGNPAYHVNLYIGPISGSLLQVNNDGSRSMATYKPGDGNEILEGSINDRGGEIRVNKNNKPARLAYYRGLPHKRVRLRELEQAYRQAGML